MNIRIGGREILLKSDDIFSPKIRKTRSDKKIRVSPSFDKETHDILKQIAKACDISKTELAHHIVFLMVRNPDFINFIQDKYKVSRNDRIIPIRTNNKIIYR